MITTRVFKNGNSQAVRIPKQFTLKDKELNIQKVGSAIILTPKNDPWKPFRDSINEFSDGLFCDGREQPAIQEREPF
mgnify:CR=1 FL=1